MLVIDQFRQGAQTRMVHLAGDGVELLQHWQLQEDTSEIQLVEWIVGHVEDFFGEEKDG